MRNVRLILQYDGTDYAGFQVQPDRRTIQSELQSALSGLLGEEITVKGASRTDAGVHACGQVVTFTTENVIPIERVLTALNALLPQAIACVTADEVPLEFHPRYAARRKQYLYRLLSRDLPSPFIGRYAWHLRYPLDVEAMTEAATFLVGKHDFAAFCAANGSAKTSVREIFTVDLQQSEDLVEARIEGDGFLYMMVRIIIGTLVEVGQGKMPPARVEEILASRDRTRAGATAPPQGLSLMRVQY